MAAILAGGTHITSDLGTGILKTRGYPNHCDTAITSSPKDPTLKEYEYSVVYKFTWPGCQACCIAISLYTY